MGEHSEYILIDIGRYGASLHDKPRGNTTGHLSTYDTDPEKILTRHGDQIVEGCPIVDKRHLLGTEGFTRNVMSSPLVDVRLKDGEVDRPEVDAFFGAALLDANRGNGMSLILAKHMTDKKFTGLSAVSIGDFVGWWAQRGARIGTVSNGEIIWVEVNDEQ